MREKKIYRVPILVALVAVVVAAIVLDNRESTSQASAIRAGRSAADPAVPSKDALSTSWYCAEGTSSADGRADETILVASVADTKAEATITVMPGGLTAPVSRSVHLEPREEVRVRVADIVAAAEPGVIVEVVGGQAVVAHELAANGDIATEPCARSAASDWYFANGTTLKGAQQYIVLFDPFGDDAIVDVTFLTDDGVQQPDSLQALSVPRRSRITIPVADALPRQREVAVHIHARSGRVVAERSQLFDGTASDGEVAHLGIALSLGAESPRREWYFPYGTTVDGATCQIAIANFSASSTTVEVNVMLDGQEPLSSQSVDLPARGVQTVDVGTRVLAGTRYAVTVTALEHRGSLRAGRGRGARGVAVVVSERGRCHHARVDAPREAMGDRVAIGQRRGCRHRGEPRYPGRSLRRFSSTTRATPPVRRASPSARSTPTASASSTSSRSERAVTMCSS